MISFLFEENEGIQNFFDGDDTYTPTSEFMYLHERPLLRPNFMTQIDDLVRQASIKIGKHKLTGKPIDQLIEYAVEMGQQLDGDMTEDKAKAILIAMRKLRNLCLEINSSLQ